MGSRRTQKGYGHWGKDSLGNEHQNVKCQDCGTTYNGKIGESNTGAIIGYCLVVGVIAIVLGILLWQR